MQFRDLHIKKYFRNNRWNASKRCYSWVCGSKTKTCI